jgi:hypothetical protein
MKRTEQWMAVVAILGSVTLAACQKKAAEHKAEHPAKIEPIEGSDLKRVTLTDRAIERIALKTDEVREQRVAPAASPQRVVPYSSLIYDPQGKTWVYTSPQPKSFVRHSVDVDRIDGDVVVLKDGPPAGTVVASQAVAELYGAEFKVGH